MRFSTVGLQSGYYIDWDATKNRGLETERCTCLPYMFFFSQSGHKDKFLNKWNIDVFGISDRRWGGFRLSVCVSSYARIVSV